MEGSMGPIPLTWADPEMQTTQQGKDDAADEAANADNRMLFFAKVLRSAPEDEIKALFTQFGAVHSINLFRAFQGAPTSKGCGLVTMCVHDDAQAAIEALNNTFVWEGMDGPMVVKWMDTALQQRRREQHLASMRAGVASGMSAGLEQSWMPPGLGFGGNVRMGMGPAGMMLGGGGGMVLGGGQGGGGGLMQGGGSDLMMEAFEPPPPGCAPDAIKLFVGNVPKSCTEEQIRPFFETIGKVAELIVVRDRNTQESKGSAFVWYATRQMAERAILQFNLRHALPDASGLQDRPLVVRRAKARARAQHPGLAAMMHPAVGMLLGGGGGGGGAVLQQQQGMLDPRFMVEYPFQQQQQGQYPGYYPARMMGGPQQPQQQQYGGLIDPMISLQGLQQQQQFGGYSQLASMARGPPGGLYDAYGQGSSSDPVDGYTLSGSSGPGGGGGSSSLSGNGNGSGPGEQPPQDNMAISIVLNQTQLASVNAHMYSVHAMSGAQLNVTAGAPGLFHLVVGGSKSQVETAKSLLSSVMNLNAG